ncbi:hypothetical protein DPMN_083990 [Dreissena polymorpha]|uniref:Uncharacterized protein n=1 Tax=Dreissena polymorpha TaxID=45954 RepID=A0A9D3YDL2_DREPO|nr:hypothetical protein DPMN_083990 [Dreissena polymorpha]
MATTVSLSLPDCIGQGHRPMPDQLAAAIRSSSGDNTGHKITGGPVRSPVTGPWHRCITDDRSGHRSPVNATGHRSSGTGPVTGRCQCYRSPGAGTVTGPWHRSPVNRDRSGHRSAVTGQHAPVIDLSTVDGHQSTIRNRRRSSSSDYSTSSSSNASSSSSSTDNRGRRRTRSYSSSTHHSRRRYDHCRSSRSARKRYTRRRHSRCSRSRSQHRRDKGRRQASRWHCRSDFHDRSHYFPISDCNVSIPYVLVSSLTSTHVAATGPTSQPFSSGVHPTTTAALSTPRDSTPSIRDTLWVQDSFGHFCTSHF